MPIKSLESYLFERKLVNTSSIEILQNATIGIDVEHYLSRIYTFKKEQFLAGIGGIPSSLNDYIQSDLQVFQEFNIKPIFVIPGLKIQLQANDYKTKEYSPQEHHLETIWNKLNSKNSNPYGGYNNLSNESFRLFTDPLPISPMINDLIKQFIANGIDYLISPYDSSFQLSYLYQNKVIDSIYGSTDLLLTHVNKFILGMEFQSKDFRFVDKTKVLNELSLTERQFLDLSIMVGCSVQPVTFPNFPPLPKPNPVQPYPQLSYFKLGLDIVFQYINFNGGSPDLHGYIASLNDPELLDLYMKGHSALKYLPILNDEGNVEPYVIEMAKLGFVNPSDLVDGKKLENGNVVSTDNSQSQTPTLSEANELAKAKNGDAENKTSEDEKPIIKVPTDIHDIISQRLPPELYLYQSIGLVPLSLLGAITQGFLNIRPPPESGLSDGYKRLITSPFYSNLVDGQFNLITQLLTRYYQVKKIKVSYWFKDEVIELNNRLPQPIYKTLNHLISYSGGDSNKAFDLIDFFGNLKEEYPASKTPFYKEIINNQDIISTSLLRTLFSFGIIDNKSNKLSSIGHILSEFIKENKDELNDDYLQELIILLLLIKSNTVKLNQSSKDFTSVPKLFKDSGSDVSLSNDELNKIALVSRVFSLHRFNVHPINYQGPISRSLLNFRSHLKFIKSNLINNLECVLIDLIVRQENNNIKVNYTNKNQWYELIDQLPFYKDLDNTLLGVVAEIFLEYTLKQQKFTSLDKQTLVKSGHDHILNTVFQINNSSFNINVNGINSIRSSQYYEDFNAGLKLWSLFIQLVQTANKIDSTLVSDSTLKEFKETDEWLKEYVA